MLYECRRWWQSHRWGEWSEARPYTDDRMPKGAVGFVQERYCAICHAQQMRSVDRLFRQSGYDAGKHADYHAGAA